MIVLQALRAFVGAMIVCIALCGTALAQMPEKGGIAGFSNKNKDQPVHIEATSLEVRDKDRIATFTGNVQVVQGDTTMRCKVLVVYYDNNQPGGAKPAPASRGSAKSTPPGGGGGGQQISRLEMKGGVIVTQQDQTATGDNGLFDMKSNTVTLLGNVTVSQGGNVVRGERLVGDMTTGVFKGESESKGPVRMMIEKNKDGTAMKPMKTPIVPTSRN